MCCMHWFKMAFVAVDAPVGAGVGVLLSLAWLTALLVPSRAIYRVLVYTGWTPGPQSLFGIV